MSYTYRGNSVEITREGAEPVKATMRWAFGAGTQAVTPVIERNGRVVEHRVSWYRDGNRLGLTPGHDAAAAVDLEDALGVVQSDRNVRRCFGCHQTRGEPGVTCQACHGDGAAHIAQPAARGAIPRDRSVTLCAQCHRSPDAAFASATPELEDPNSIRFAPVGLLASRCYQRSAAGKLTCVSCHNPHGEAAPEPSKVCAECHAAVRARASCPRTAGRCVGCHMQTSSPTPGLRFTDHRIRVYGANRKTR